MARKPTPSSSSPALLLIAHFAELPEPRRHQHKIRYPLPLLLLIVFAAMLSGFSGWDAFAQFAEARREWLRRLVPFEGDNTPCADTLRTVFERLRADVFSRCFQRWAASLAERVPGRHLAVDGKSLQGACDADNPTTPLHLLHVWLVDQQLLLATVPVDGAPGEPLALPGLLSLLELEEAVVTMDANGCTRAVTDTIVQGGGDYLACLKANRGPAHAAVEAYFASHNTGLGLSESGKKEGMKYAQQGDRGHGRTELRQAWAVPASRIPEVTSYLPHARSVLCLVRSRQTATTWSCETHYYVSSMRPQAERQAAIVRRHWSVENELHRTLDVVLQEDATKVRHGPGALNLALVRRQVEAVLRRDTRLKGSMPKRMRQALLDDDYRAHLLSLVVS